MLITMEEEEDSLAEEIIMQIITIITTLTLKPEGEIDREEEAMNHKQSMIYKIINLSSSSNSKGVVVSLVEEVVVLVTITIILM